MNGDDWVGWVSFVYFLGFAPVFSLGHCNTPIHRLRARIRKTTGLFTLRLSHSLTTPNPDKKYKVSGAYLVIQVGSV